jgi:hypothetical protein
LIPVNLTYHAILERRPPRSRKTGLNLTFAGGLEGHQIEWGTDSRLVLSLLGFAILANAAMVFVEAGLHMSLDDNPDRYKLFYDLTGSAALARGRGACEPGHGRDRSTRYST